MWKKEPLPDHFVVENVFDEHSVFIQIFRKESDDLGDLPICCIVRYKDGSPGSMILTDDLGDLSDIIDKLRDL